MDPGQWPAHSWWHRLRHAVGRLDEVVEPGRPFLLADGGTWGLTASSARRARPFPARDGVWWGPPVDDRHAVSALERERATGAAVLVVAWPCFWWLEHYEGFARHLRDRYPCLVRDDSLMVFDLA